MKISKCDNSLITGQKQTIIVGAKQRSALANYIRPKQRLGRMQYARTIRKEGKKEKNIKNNVTFVTFVTLLLLKLSEIEVINSDMRVTKVCTGVTFIV